MPPKREVLNGIWLSFYPGAKIGVVGPNGSGKSTPMRALRVRIRKLDSMISFKSHCVAPKTCNAGSPRITPLIDADGDGNFDQEDGDFACRNDWGRRRRGRCTGHDAAGINHG